MTLTKRILLMIGIVIMGTSMSALAAPTKGKAMPPKTVSKEFNYSYVEAGLADYEIDSAIQIRGSVRLTDEFFLAGTLAISDLKVFKAGFGYRYAIFDNLDAYGHGGFAKYESDEVTTTRTVNIPPFPPVIIQATVPGYDDNGLYATAGVRYSINRDFEVGGGIDVFAGDDSDARPFAGATYHLNKEFSFSAEYLGGDFDNIFLSGRYNF